MPSWNDILAEITQENMRLASQGPFDVVRRRYLAQLHELTNRNIIAYYSGFLTKGQQSPYATSITDDDLSGFMSAIHNLDRSKGLDLIIHTPGGSITATERLVSYLRKMFGKDIRAIVPQLAQSAGTILACTCKSIVMSKHSSLGPIDPQVFGGIPAYGIIEDLRRAIEEISADPAKAAFWQIVLGKYPLSFISECENAIKMTKDFVAQELAANMFSDLSRDEAKEIAKDITDRISNYHANLAHDRNYDVDFCDALGFRIERLEHNQALQDTILTVHHCYSHTLSNTQAVKIIENHLGVATIKFFT